MKVNRSASLLAALFIFVSATVAQKAEPWMAISSAEGEFSGVIPKDSLVINEDKSHTRLITYSADLRLEIGRRLVVGGRRYLLGRPGGVTDQHTKTFELGKTRGRITMVEKGGRYSVSVYAISPNYTYSINVSGKRADDPRILRFLKELKFSGQPLLTIASQSSDETVELINMKDLKSSLIVKEYLKKPVNKNVVVKYERVDDRIPVAKTVEDDDDKPDQSEPAKSLVTRPLIILEMPKARFTSEARSRGVGGAIKTVVLLKSDGTVGAITVDPGVDLGLASNVVEAAKHIKFIPEEAEGKPVDVKRRFVYSFSIY